MDNWGSVLGGGVIGYALGASNGCGGGLFGGGNCDRGRCATTEDVASGFNFAGVNNSLKDLMIGQAGINQNLGGAICQIGYQSLEQAAALGSKVDNGNYQTLMAIKDLGASLKDDKIASLQQQLTAMQIQQATCGIPKTSPYAWGVYPYTCNPCVTCGNGAF